MGREYVSRVWLLLLRLLFSLTRPKHGVFVCVFYGFHGANRVSSLRQGKLEITELTSDDAEVNRIIQIPRI